MEGILPRTCAKYDGLSKGEFGGGGCSWAGDVVQRHTGTTTQRTPSQGEGGGGGRGGMGNMEGTLSRTCAKAEG